MDFDQAFDVLIGHEGGYVNHPQDPGGETNFGISKRSYPNTDIKTLTRDGAKAIYKRDFWSPAHCDDLPESVRFDVFDTAVNSGVGQAIKLLQRSVGVVDDGRFGPVTLAAVKALNPASMVACYNGARLAMMTDLPTWSDFGKGWARRIADNLRRA